MYFYDIDIKFNVIRVHFVYVYTNENSTKKCKYHTLIKWIFYFVFMRPVNRRNFYFLLLHIKETVGCEMLNEWVLGINKQRTCQFKVSAKNGSIFYENACFSVQFALRLEEHSVKYEMKTSF